MAESFAGLLGSADEDMRSSSAAMAGVKFGVYAGGRCGCGATVVADDASSSAAMRASAAARWVGVGSASTSVVS